MVARALGVSFRQALRSVALTLFPLAFIALFSWASAGTIAGNTSDPVRASAWLYLGAHLIPFTVPSGKLTVLPLLAVIYPMWAIRRGLPSVEEAFSKLNGARIIYSLWYAILSEVLAVTSIHHGISANLYLTPVMTFVIAMIATARFERSRSPIFYFALYLLSIALGVGAIAFAISLQGHFKEVKSISVVLSAGVVGGILLTLLQLLYLPNIAISSIAYLTGIGFSFGAHTTVTGAHVTLGQVPALPFVAGLPTGVHRDLKYGLLFWFLLFALLLIFAQRKREPLLNLSRRVISEGARLLTALAIITFLSAGELLTSQLNPIGVIWWRLLEYLAVTFATAAVLVLALPAAIRSVVRGE